MKYELATIGLIPILLLQGRYVRRTIPNLLEPEGDRFGKQGTGSQLRLFILGDSAAAGVGVHTQQEGLSGQVVSELCADYQVSWKLNARTGHTAQDVLNMLKQTSAEHYEVALISVGVNDVTGRTALKKWTVQLGQIIDLLKTKFGVQHIILSSLPAMHLFKSLPQPLRWYVGLRAKQLNVKLQEIVHADNHCELVTLDLPFKSDFFAADGFHPAAPVYAVWGKLAATIIRGRVKDKMG